jgi:competence protein ComEC
MHRSEIRKVPFIRVLIPFVAGILLAIYRPLFHWGFYPVFLFLLFLLWWGHRKRYRYHQRWKYGLLYFMYLFIAGFLLQVKETPEHHLLHYAQKPTEATLQIIGEIEHVDTLRQSFRLKLDVKRVARIASDTFYTRTGQLQVYVKKKGSENSFHTGQWMWIEADLSRIPPLSNPKAFDYQHYLALQDIYFQASATPGKWKVIRDVPPGFIQQWRIDAQEKLGSYLDRKQVFAVVSAMLLGEKTDLSPEVKAMYANTGAMHILAVSGLHVGIIYLLLELFLKRLPFNRNSRWIKTLIQLVGIWLFALLTGGAASVIRASTMFSFLHIGKLIQRHSSIYNTLAASAFFLLCCQPSWLLHVGFQLSYLAVGGIVFFQPLFYRWWIPRWKLVDFLWKLITVSLAAQLLTLPLSWYYFHQFPSFFWLSGLWVVPLAPVIITMGIGILIADGCWPFLAKGLATLLDHIIRITHLWLEWLQQLPFSTITDIWVQPIQVIALYTAIFGVGLMMRQIPKPGYILSVVGLTIYGSFHIAAVIEQQRQEYVVVYDAGREVLIDYIKGRQRLELRSASITDRSIYFAAANFRSYLGTQEMKKAELSTDTIYQFPEAGIGIWGASCAVMDTWILPVSHINQTMMAMGKESPQKIVFAGRLYYKDLKRWKEWCTENEKECFFTQSEGAFLLKRDRRSGNFLRCHFR